MDRAVAVSLDDRFRENDIHTVVVQGSYEERSRQTKDQMERGERAPSGVSVDHSRAAGAVGEPPPPPPAGEEGSAS